MPELVRHRPPSLKLAHDDAKNDVILRIVSPIATLSMSQNMKNTMRISESIRRRQSSIIAAKNNENPIDSSLDLDAQKLPLESPKQPNKETPAEQPNSGLTGANSSGNTAVNSALNSSESSASSSATSTVYPAHVKGESLSLPVSAPPATTQLSPGAYSSLDRVGSLHKRSLKRERIPKPLKLHQHAAFGTGPYTAAIGPPGVYLAQMNGFKSAPLRSYFPGVPRVVHHIRARPPLVPIGHPYTVIQTPYQRNMPVVADRRAPRVAKALLAVPSNGTHSRSPSLNGSQSLKRPCPVQDIFPGDVKKAAPLPLQPPLAQNEKFAYTAPDDREAATEEEMEEMRRKWEEGDEIFGCVSFMDKLTYRFKILNKNLSLDEKKAKFMKICETTWDEFMKEKPANRHM